MSYTRRGITRVSEGIADTRCPSTCRASSVRFQRPSSKPDGWYRTRCYFEGGSSSAELGAKIDPVREAARLLKLGERRAYARTFSPGISGYEQRERASREAAAAKIDESKQLGLMLAEWQAGHDDGYDRGCDENS